MMSIKQQSALAKTCLFLGQLLSWIFSCGTFCSLSADSSGESSSAPRACVCCAQEAHSSSNASFLSTLLRLTERACCSVLLQLVSTDELLNTDTDLPREFSCLGHTVILQREVLLIVVFSRAPLSLSCVPKTEVSLELSARIVGTRLLFKCRSQFLNTLILRWWSVRNHWPPRPARKTCEQCCSQVKPVAELWQLGLQNKVSSEPHCACFPVDLSLQTPTCTMCTAQKPFCLLNKLAAGEDSNFLGYKNLTFFW